MTFLGILVDLWMSVLLASAKDIFVTISNSSGDYYIVSPQSNYKYGTINCNAFNCYIECNQYQSCQGIVVNNKFISSTITMKCMADSSCNYAIINSAHSSVFTLKCTSNLACSGSKLFGTPTNEVNIFCQSANSCKSSNFTITTTPNVNIICNSSQSNPASDYYPFNYNGACNSAYFDASKSIKFTATCNDYNCQNTKFYVNHSHSAIFNMNGNNSVWASYICGSSISDSLTVSCFDRISCQGTHIYCPIDANCNINCIKQDSCYYGDIYDSTTGTYIHIRTYIHITNEQYKYLNIQSLYGVSNAIHLECTDINIGGKAYYDTINQKWTCDSYGCCPYYDGDISCDFNMPYSTTYPTENPTENCIIYCRGTYCQNKIIYGRNTSSLTVYCFDESCEASNIQCPSGDDTSCNVICFNDYSCAYSGIYLTANITNTLNVSCYDQYSCWLMVLSSNNIYQIKNVSLHCSGYESCDSQHIDFSKVRIISDVLDIKCMAIGYVHTCSSSTIIGPSDYISYVNLKFDSYGAEDLIMSSIKVIENVNIMCIGLGSCQRGTFHLALLTDNVNVDIVCNDQSGLGGTYIGYACRYTQFLIEGVKNGENNVTIACSQNDCKEATFDFSNINQIEIDCFAPSSCQNSRISTVDSNSLHVWCRNNEDSCGGIYISCDNALVYDPTSNEYTCCKTSRTTITPTIKPTTRATIIPTIRPTIQPTTWAITSTLSPTETGWKTTDQSAPIVDTNNGEGFPVLVVVVVVVGVALISVAIVLVYVMMKKKRKANNEKYQQITVSMTNTTK